MKKLLSLLLVVPLIACEKTIDYEGDISEPVIVFGASNVLSPGFGIGQDEDSLQIILSKSVSILDFEQPEALSGATVQIRENNGPWVTLIEPYNGYYRTSSIQPSAGNKYYMKASADGFESISASCQIPQPSPITRVEFIGEVEEDTVNWTQGYREYDVTFHDPGGTRYYSISCEYRYSLTTGIPPIYARITSNSPYAQGVNDGEQFYYTDENLFSINTLYEGTNVTIPIRVFTDTQLTNLDDYSLYVTLRTMDEHAYKYHVSRQRYSIYGSDSGPFGQPIQVYTNIENGLGFFGGYSSHEKKEG